MVLEKLKEITNSKTKCFNCKLPHSHKGLVPGNPVKCYVDINRDIVFTECAKCGRIYKKDEDEKPTTKEKLAAYEKLYEKLYNEIEAAKYKILNNKREIKRLAKEQSELKRLRGVATETLRNLRKLHLKSA